MVHHNFNFEFLVCSLVSISELKTKDNHLSQELRIRGRVILRKQVAKGERFQLILKVHKLMLFKVSVFVTVLLY